MGLPSYRVSVPGSLMLFGEHAVLKHKQAVVVAINRYLQVRLVPRFDRQIKIISPIFGSYVTTLDKFRVAAPYSYVLQAIRQSLTKIKSGFVLEINADFSSIGFGSSAAVTVATLGVLERWLGKSEGDDLMRLYRRAVSVIRLVQGVGSGADAAASVFGGIIAYRTRPLAIKKLPGVFPLVAVYSGTKMATAKVVSKVEGERQQFLSIFQQLYGAIDSCAVAAILAINHQEWRRLGKLMNIHQGLQDALGVNNPLLTELIFSLRKSKQIYGAKISGSGLGDCVIGLGRVKKNNFPENKLQQQCGVRQIEVAVSPAGFSCLD